MDVSSMWEFLVTKAGRMYSMSPPEGATAEDMELGPKVQALLEREFAEAPTERLDRGDVESTARLRPGWFGGAE